MSTTSKGMAGRIAILVTALAAAQPASAATDGCAAAIAAAWAKIGEVPAYRQTVVMAEPKMRMDMVVIGNTFYSTNAGKTDRIELKPGGRKAIVERFAGATPTLACAQVGEETIDGRPTLVYDFTRAPVPGLEKEPMRQKVWIGKADGLVRRLVGNRVTIDVAYEDVAAPR